MKVNNKYKQLPEWENDHLIVIASEAAGERSNLLNHYYPVVGIWPTGSAWNKEAARTGETIFHPLIQLPR